MVYDGCAETEAIADLSLRYSVVCLMSLAGAVCVDANGSAYQSFKKHVLFKKVDDEGDMVIKPVQYWIGGDNQS